MTDGDLSSVSLHAQNIGSLKLKHIPAKWVWLKFGFYSDQLGPATTQPTFVSSHTAPQPPTDVQSNNNKLLIYLTLNIWLQSAGRTGSTEMTPVGPETGRHSQIFRRNTLERSAPNRLTSRRKPCLGSAWLQRETWFTSKDEKYWNFTVLSEAMHVLCGYLWSKLGMLEGYRWCHVCINNIVQ